jgi:4,5-DOPA dioxygenase extradiol
MRDMDKTMMPVMFVGHGSPMVSIEDDPYTETLTKFGQSLPRPRAIIVLSAHWESAKPLRVTASKNPRTLYDFFGFPPELYQLTYPSPGDPELALKVVQVFSTLKIEVIPDKLHGIDHGAWVPLRRIFPKADIPVIQITLPFPRRPNEIMEMGHTLKSLREEQIFLVGSGNLVHNLRRVHFDDKYAPVDSWAKEMDDWLKEKIARHDVSHLINYRESAPHVTMGAQTTEHFDPLFFVLGAAPGEPMTTVFEGFHYGNLSMRTFILG